MRPLGSQPRGLRARVSGDQAAGPSARVHPIWTMPRVSGSARLDRNVRRAPRRLAVAYTLLALSAANWAAASARGQGPPSDAGQTDPGESASAWHDVLAFLGWILLAVVVFGLLVWMALGAPRRRSQPSPDGPEPTGPATGSPRPRRVEARGEAGATELTVLAFDHTEGAEHAYADARGRANDAPWLREVAFVECHRRGRIVVRGTFAGHYLDVDDLADAMGHDTAVGAVAGAVVGLAFGPPGFAAGLVAGGTAGALRESTDAPEERGALFDEIRRDVPEGSSGLVALVSPDDSEALIEALHHRAVRVTRHRLSAAEGAALHAAVAPAPRAATSDV
jgi:uncharacterized membrane protein